MKFVCDRCQTRYSIADEKVRQKILRIRCKTCGNVIVVQEEHSRSQTAGETPAPEPRRPASSGSPQAVSASGPKPPPSSGPKAAPAAPEAPSSGPKPPPLPRLARGTDPLGGHVEWYLAVDGEQSGPFSRSEIAKRVQAAGPGKSVHVWKEGMANWKPPQEVSVVAHELSLLRPSPPPPPRPPAAAVPAAPAVPADSEVTTPLPLAGPAKAPVVAEAARDDITTPDTSGFSDITTKRGKELRQVPGADVPDDFGEVTTKKTRDLREVLGSSLPTGYTEATTKKSKNLHELEADAPTAPGAAPGEPDRTPPPMKPLPPVGSKVAAPVPSAVRLPAPMPDPVVSFETPPSGPTPRPSASFGIPGAPLTPAPVFRAAPGSAASRPAPAAVPTAAIASPASAPFVVTAPRGPLLSPGDLPTPRPINVAPFGGLDAPAAPPEAPPVPGGMAGLFQRQPGLKYVVAALAIVVLIILLGLVILRGGDRVTDSENAAPIESESPKAEEPKVAEPEAVAAEPPPPAPAEKPAPAAPASGKSSPGSSGRAVRHVARASERAPRVVPERAPKEKPSATPPRLAGARPNPFDESRNVSQAQITAVVRNPTNQAALKSCYERALKMDNHLTSGRIDVTVSIAASGSVQRVVINAPSSFILVEPCIKSAVKRWSFPPNLEDYATNFPLIMQGGM